MCTIDETEEMLSQIAAKIPDAFFKYLNGGIILLPDVKLHPESTGGDDLYILGEYQTRHDLGRCICIYYGSMMRVYGNAPPSVLHDALRHTLLHEFTHHLESLAGERDLEIKDEMRLEDYRRRVRRKAEFKSPPHDVEREK